MTRVALAAAAATALVLVAAGCGGESTTETATGSTANQTQAWTNGVCSALATWKSDLQQARTSLGDPGSISRNSIDAAVEQMRSANAKLSASVHDLTRPPTVTGQQATQTMDTLRDQLESDAKEIQAMLNSPDTSAPLATVSRVTGTLATMRVQVQAAVADLKKLDVEGELETAVEASPACEPFRKQ
jgi:hypothetical protein